MKTMGEIERMTGTVFEILRGHVGALDGNDYFPENKDSDGTIDGELISKKAADALLKKGFIRVKPSRPKSTPKKKGK
jgi:hypothetical protein